MMNANASYEIIWERSLEEAGRRKKEKKKVCVQYVKNAVTVPSAYSQPEEKLETSCTLRPSCCYPAVTKLRHISAIFPEHVIHSALALVPK